MLKHYDAYDSIRTNTCKESYQNDFAAIVEQTFDNASNVFYNEIEIESAYGSNEFIKIPMVRVDSIINFSTGVALGDDFKSFLFKPDFSKPIYGMKFKWKDNYWLVINTNNEESINISAEVRRCNNQLRFFDNYGNKVYEPCIVDYVLKQASNNETSPITIGNSSLKIWCQRNLKTQFLKPNDKFLFGTPSQRIALRIVAGGLKNILNTLTEDDNSPSLTEFMTEHYQISPLMDDLENGFANAYANNFQIEISNSSSKYYNGVSEQLNATVYHNDDVLDVPILWGSSNEEIATITSNGLLTTIGNGTTTISVKMADNINIYENIDIEVSELPLEDEYQIVLEPNINYVLQNKYIDFECWLYKNGLKQDDGFIFYDISEGVPRDKYKILTIDNNHFRVENKGMFMDKPVIIQCVSGDREKLYNVALRGLY